MINIKVEKAGKYGVQVEAEVKVNGTQRECVEEFAGVLSALRKSSEEIYLLAAMADTQRAIEEREHDDEE